MSNLPGDSSEQKEAEGVLLESFSHKHGVTLTKKIFSLEEGNRIELDGFCERPPVICEAWAHIGPPKSAQKNKVMTDAFKLIFAKSLLDNTAKCYLVFADYEAAHQFQGNSWMAQCLKKYNVIIEVLELPLEIKNRVLKAQARQYR